MDVGKTPETAAGLFFLWELKALLYVGFITECEPVSYRMEQIHTLLAYIVASLRFRCFALKA